MAHTNVQLVSGNLTTGETEPTFFIDRVNNKVGIKTVPDPTDSNVFQINGGVVATQLYGDGSQLTGLNDSKWIESISNPDDIYYSLGNVGVGTDNPNFTLDVNGDINFTGTFNRNGEEFESSPWTRSGDDLTYITGNVGIGTTDTDHTLTVQGNFNIKNTMTAKQVENQLFWATRIGGDDSDYGQGIAVDSGGNVYVTGRYRSNPVTLYSEDGVTTETLTNDGNYDVFIAKYSTDGNVLWAARISGTAYDSGLGIAVDSGGNVYVAGLYKSNPLTLYSENESSTSKTLTNDGGYDAFIAKYSTGGNVLWAARIGGIDTEYGRGIAVDSGGNVYVTGRYRTDPVTLYSENESSTSKTLTTDRSNNVFIAKYSTGGNVLWAARIGGSSAENGEGIAVDSGGNVYVTGHYSSNPVTLYSENESSTSKTLTNGGNYDVFIAKYSTDGNVLWAARISGIGYDSGEGIAVDSGGNVYVTGLYVSNQVTLYSENESSTSKTLTNGGGYEAFIAKYSTDGNVLWAARIGGSNTDYGYGIAADSGGNVYVTGRYESAPITLYSENESSTSKTLTNGGGYDAFIARYSTDGNVLWAARIGGIGAEYGLEIAVDSGGNVYVTGHYSSNPVTLYNEDESDSKTLTNAGGPDVFIAKYGTEYRVGVGIENPTSALDVAGQVKANGTILTFTGQHICTPEGPMDQGLIVSANKNMYTTLNGPLLIGSRAIQSSESLPVVCLSSIENDPSVFGVVDHLENGGTQRLQDRGGIITKSTKIIGDDRVIVNSSGEGAMWVVDTNGSLLATGDYITTSSISGYGHKQDDDILHSYTVAKITMDCNFNPDDLPIQVIKKDEDGNNVLDKYGRLQWEDTDRVEKAYQVRYLTSEGEVTDEANAVWTAAYVGCTYHCG
jgi:hypothetical protein